MINPNALPTSPTVQDFQNLESALDSSDYNDTLQAMQYMKRKPTGGLNRLPQVTVPMQEGGMMEEAIMEKQDMEPEEAMLMEQVEQQDPRQPNPEAMAMAQQVASYGRGGDKLILHVRPDELQGLASMLTITINPETGMPEAFLKGLRRLGSKITKPVRKIAKSKAFKTLAPIALAIAAPYAGAYLMGGSTVGLSAAVKAMSPTMFGGFTGLGSLAGNLLAGRSFGDSAKAGLISGFTAGVGRGISNKMAGKTFMGKSPTPTIDPEGYQAAGMDIVPTEGSPQVFTDQYTLPREVKMERGFTTEGIDLGTGSYEDVVKPISEPLKSTISNVVESQTIEPRTLTGGLKEVGSAIAQDFNPMTKSGLMNIASKGLTGDIGASVVESQNIAEQSEQQAENELADMGYTFSGFGDQRVITDPSGVTLPATLTAQQILARALGGGRFQFAERTAFEPVVAAQGGLIELAQGGEFSGMVPGQGGGMDDNVFMPIKEGREQVGTLAVSPTEYVVDSYTMAALGDGNPEEGARVMDKTIKQIREKAFGNTKQPNEIDGLAALKPMVQGV
tara:strand:- start:6939 stop:8621 length:1683 start_codon:yes stop_codon:yes gene_type:complete